MGETSRLREKGQGPLQMKVCTIYTCDNYVAIDVTCVLDIGLP